MCRTWLQDRRRLIGSEKVQQPFDSCPATTASDHQTAQPDQQRHQMVSNYIKLHLMLHDFSENTNTSIKLQFYLSLIYQDPLVQIMCEDYCKIYICKRQPASLLAVAEYNCRYFWATNLNETKQFFSSQATDRRNCQVIIGLCFASGCNWLPDPIGLALQETLWKML